MNEANVLRLLRLWDELIKSGELSSKEKAEKSSGGLIGRIKRTTGTPVIFDLDSYTEQTNVQNSLCQELPQWADLIRSKPEIMDGHPWTRNDFIELYFGHFRLVVSKLYNIIDRSTAV